MESNRIPRPAVPHERQVIIPPSFQPSDDVITFSFEVLERTEYFNLDSTCNNWPSDLFLMLKSISSISRKHLLSGTYRTYRVHSHEGVTPPCPLPAGVKIGDCYQLRISSAKGGIHGIFINNVFYVIWLDPLHNLYPDKRYGGLRVIRAPSTCCMERDSEIDRLIQENQELKQENLCWINECEKNLLELDELKNS